MMRKLMAVMLFFTLGGIVSADDAAPKTSPAPAAKPARPKTVTIDLRKPIDLTLNLTEGDSFVFENGRPSTKVSVKETDGKGNLFVGGKQNAFNQTGANTATRAGTGEIKLEMSHQGLLAVMKTYIIKVTVKPRLGCVVPSTHTIDLEGAKLPKTLTLKVGDQVTAKFSNVAGGVILVDSSVKVTDGNKALLLGAANRKNPSSDWNAKREGTGKLTITYKHSAKGPELTHDITVVVTP